MTPKHVAIIMDGNRRWAKSRNLPPAVGHWEGAEKLTEIVRHASELGVQTLTVFTFSTENWKRSPEEVDSLMNILEIYLYKKKDQMIQDGVKLGAIGDLSALPKNVRDAYESTRKATEHCNKINLVIAVNYGGRDELRRAIAKILSDNVKPENVTEELIAKHLDTYPYGDPELLIRTSGEFRVSNFLLWQICYSEIYTTPVLWPDFLPHHFSEAITHYQSRDRRRGF